MAAAVTLALAPVMKNRIRVAPRSADDYRDCERRLRNARIPFDHGRREAEWFAIFVDDQFLKDALMLLAQAGCKATLV
jgi:hypothetical protein